MAENTEWIALGRVIGDTGPKGDTGVGTTIKGSYDTLEELIAEHPTGNDTDAYLVDGSFYFWNGVIQVIKAILVRKVVKETKARLEQLDKKENKDLKEILETQDLLEILDRPVQLGTLELLVLLLLLKVHIILTRN